MELRGVFGGKGWRFGGWEIEREGLEDRGRGLKIEMKKLEHQGFEGFPTKNRLKLDITSKLPTYQKTFAKSRKPTKLFQPFLYGKRFSNFSAP
jgi:hypothetical protein